MFDSNNRCTLWLKYGILASETTVIFVNCVGSALFFSYFIVFWMFTVNTAPIYRQFFGAILVLGLTFSYTDYYEINRSEALEVVGKFWANYSEEISWFSYQFSLIFYRLHLLYHIGFILRSTMLYADGRYSNEINRNATTSINLDDLYRFSAMVCIWSYSKWSISANSQSSWCFSIWCAINAVLYLSQ